VFHASTNKYPYGKSSETNRRKMPNEKAAVRRIVPIGECGTCIDLADQAFESGTEVEIGNVAVRFLEHVMNEHTGEVINLLAEKYGPIFMTKRAMR
jgi:hypothetical protein